MHTCKFKNGGSGSRAGGENARELDEDVDSQDYASSSR